jgi:hypothetical protein
VIEGNCGWLLDGVVTVKQALTLSEDPSLTLEILSKAIRAFGAHTRSS